MALFSSESSDGEDAKHFSGSGAAPGPFIPAGAVPDIWTLRAAAAAANATPSASSSSAARGMADLDETTVGIMHPNRDFFDNPPEPAPNASPHNHFHPGEAGEPRVSRSRAMVRRAFVVCLVFVGVEGGIGQW